MKDNISRSFEMRHVIHDTRISSGQWPRCDVTNGTCGSQDFQGHTKKTPTKAYSCQKFENFLKHMSSNYELLKDCSLEYHDIKKTHSPDLPSLTCPSNASTYAAAKACNSVTRESVKKRWIHIVKLLHWFAVENKRYFCLMAEASDHGYVLHTRHIHVTRYRIRIQHQWRLGILNQFSVLIYAVCHILPSFVSCQGCVVHWWVFGVPWYTSLLEWKYAIQFSNE
jgi:hypothetical protein